MMAYVHEPYAANYKFTSAMPAQLLKVLTPALLPLVDGGGCGAAPDVRTATAAAAANSPLTGRVEGSHPSGSRSTILRVGARA